MKTEHDKLKRRFAFSSLVALTSAAVWMSPVQPIARAQMAETAFGNPLARVRHIIVIYQENWSFDSLYGKFPGANGFAYSFPTIPQIDLNGNPICELPQPIGNNGAPDPRFPANLPVLPYDSRSIPLSRRIAHTPPARTRTS